MESRQWHNLSAGVCQDSAAREKIGDREASRGGGCPHYTKNLIQIKEVNLDFWGNERHHLLPPLGLLLMRQRFRSVTKTAAVAAGAGPRITSLKRRRPLHLRPCAGARRRGLRRANRERNAPNPALANFSSHARCHTGHTVTHIKTLEIFKTQRAKQGLACSRRRPPPTPRPLYGNVWRRERSFCCLCGSLRAYVICKSSGHIRTLWCPKRTGRGMKQ